MKKWKIITLETEKEKEIALNYYVLRRDYTVIRQLFKKYINSFALERDDMELVASFDAQIGEIIDKAEKYDLKRLKQSEGGKKSAKNMTKAERIERARKAGKAKKA